MFTASYEDLINMAELQGRVEAGAKWLDNEFPDWFEKIDTDSLRISSGSACICGQLFVGKVLRQTDPTLYRALLERDALTEEDAIHDGFGYFTTHYDDLSAEDFGFIFIGESTIDPNVTVWGSYSQFDYLGACWVEQINQRKHEAGIA
jgi:hypothetical protein